MNAVMEGRLNQGHGRAHQAELKGSKETNASRKSFLSHRSIVWFDLKYMRIAIVSHGQCKFVARFPAMTTHRHRGSFCILKHCILVIYIADLASKCGRVDDVGPRSVQGTGEGITTRPKGDFQPGPSRISVFHLIYLCRIYWRRPTTVAVRAIAEAEPGRFDPSPPRSATSAGCICEFITPLLVFKVLLAHNIHNFPSCACFEVCTMQNRPDLRGPCLT